MKVYQTNSPTDTYSTALAILKDFPNNRIITLSGELGAGKTTLSQGFGLALGVNRMVSPTFTIIREYDLRSDKFKRLYHIDLYRLGSIDEALALGIEEMFNEPKSLVLIEWPEKIFPILPSGTLRIVINKTGPESRQLTVNQ
jgi:tRNA threonylcarbamoyladenosine biosynthesis protein TsaE